MSLEIDPITIFAAKMRLLDRILEGVPVVDVAETGEKSSYRVENDLLKDAVKAANTAIEKLLA